MTATVLQFRPKASLAEKFARDLDAKLPAFPDDAFRLRFLEALEYRWTRRYVMFRQNVASDRYDERDGVTAFDYAMTISEISIRRARIEAAMRGVAS